MKNIHPKIQVLCVYKSWRRKTTIIVNNLATYQYQYAILKNIIRKIQSIINKVHLILTLQSDVNGMDVVYIFFL